MHIISFIILQLGQDEEIDGTHVEEFLLQCQVCLFKKKKLKKLKNEKERTKSNYQVHAMNNAKKQHNK